MADVTIAGEAEEMRRSAPTDPDSPMAAFDHEQAELAQVLPPLRERGVEPIAVSLRAGA